MTILYQTPTMKIGKNEWRLIVRPSPYGGNCTEYQWRRPNLHDLPADVYEQRHPWRCERVFHGYNINDGTYMGLPRTLVKIYKRHEAEIKAAMTGEPMAQGSLAL